MTRLSRTATYCFAFSLLLPAACDDDTDKSPMHPPTSDGGLPDASGVQGDTSAQSPDAAPIVYTGSSYLPLAVGNSWSYNITHPIDGLSTKTTSVKLFEKVGFQPRYREQKPYTGANKDKDAFLVESLFVRGAKKDRTISWQNREGDLVVRYREVAFKESSGGTLFDTGDFWAPYKLRVSGAPAQIVKGAKYPDIYTETKTRALGDSTFNRRDDWEVLETGQTATVIAGTFQNCIVMKKTSTSAVPPVSKIFTFCRGVGKIKEVGKQTEELTALTIIQ